MFRRLLTHPAAVARLHWMCGPGFRASYAGRVACWERGVGGQALHGDPTDFSAVQNYSYYSFDGAASRGRICHSEHRYSSERAQQQL